MSYLALAVIGYYAYTKLPVSLMPKISVPEISVHLSHPNFSARQIEETLVSSLRTQLLQVSEIQDIYSEVRHGHSRISIRFPYGTNIDFAFLEVNEKIDLAMKDFPREIERPKVFRSNLSDLPVLYLNVSYKINSTIFQKPLPLERSLLAENFLELSHFSERILKRQIEQLPEISMADISGIVQSEIHIYPRRDVLNVLGIELDQIHQALHDNNQNFGNIEVKEGALIYQVNFRSSLSTIEDIENLFISREIPAGFQDDLEVFDKNSTSKNSNRLIKLKEIADVKLVSKVPPGIILSQGNPCISFAILKQADAKFLDLKKSLNTLLNRVGKEYPNLQFELVQDQSQLLALTLKNLNISLIVSIVLASVILLFFLHHIKLTFLVCISIPLSIIVSFIFFKLGGLSINIISLSGLILAVGMMVDNAIIIIDNISHHYSQDLEIHKACITGTQEVISPLLASTLTTIAVFLPLIYFGDIPGTIFYEQALAISMGLGTSFFISITLIPTFYFLLFKDISKKLGTERTFSWDVTSYLVIHYKKFQKIVFSNTLLITLTLVFQIGILPIIFFYTKKELFPPLRNREIHLSLDWNENITVFENAERIQSLFSNISLKPKYWDVRIGPQQFLSVDETELDDSNAGIFLHASSYDSLELIRQEIFKFISANYPKADAEFSPPHNSFTKIFPKNPDQTTIKIYPSYFDPIILQTIIDVKGWIEKNLRLHSVNQLQQDESLILELNQDRIFYLGLNPSKVLDYVRLALQSHNISTLHSSQDHIPIILAESENLFQNSLWRISVPTTKGNHIPLGELIKLKKVKSLKTIYGGNDGEYIPIHYEILDSSKHEFTSLYTEIFRKYPNIDISISDNADSANNYIYKLSFIFLLSVLLLYFILTAQFESLLLPLILLIEIPIAILGSLALLYLTDTSLNIMSGIGIIISCGIVLNDSILKIDTINQLLSQGTSLNWAIEEGSIKRFRPIIMTSLTTIFAVFPFFFFDGIGSELQKPMALSIIGGMLSGTVFSLFFIPLLFKFFHIRISSK